MGSEQSTEASTEEKEEVEENPWHPVGGYFMCGPGGVNESGCTLSYTCFSDPSLAGSFTVEH